jgi:hypothetical protein
LFAQHGSPMPPQCWQNPLPPPNMVQTDEGSVHEPLQQGCITAPHGPHMPPPPPPLQPRPVLHVSPAQQGCIEAPHGPHMPPWHETPAPVQVKPAQQG